MIKCFRVLGGLSDTLQSTNINLAKAADLATATIQILEGYRTTEYWVKVYSYATMVSNHYKITVESCGKRSKRQSQLPNKFDNAMVLTSVGHREVHNISISEHFKVTLFYPVLDAFVSELKKRFSFGNVQVMQGIQACNPEGNTFLQVDRLLMVADKYRVDVEAVKTEATLAKATLRDKAMDDICDVFCELIPLKLAFQNLIKVVQIAMTIGVTSAKCERCFSSLKIIKTYRWSTMNEIV